MNLSEIELSLPDDIEEHKKKSQKKFKNLQDIICSQLETLE
ncbi:hypothetical protein V9J15_04630 [Candidatus Liberibacter africanus]